MKALIFLGIGLALCFVQAACLVALHNLWFKKEEGFECASCGAKWKDDEEFLMLGIGGLKFCDIDCKLQYSGISEQEHNEGINGDL